MPRTPRYSQHRTGGLHRWWAPVVLPVTFILDEDAVVFAPEPTRSSRPRRAGAVWPSKSTTSNRLYASAGASASVGRQQPVQCPMY